MKSPNPTNSNYIEKLKRQHMSSGKKPADERKTSANSALSGGRFSQRSNQSPPPQNQPMLKRDLATRRLGSPRGQLVSNNSTPYVTKLKSEVTKSVLTPHVQSVMMEPMKAKLSSGGKKITPRMIPSTPHSSMTAIIKKEDLGKKSVVR